MCGHEKIARQHWATEQELLWVKGAFEIALGYIHDSALEAFNSAMVEHSKAHPFKKLRPVPPNPATIGFLDAKTP